MSNDLLSYIKVHRGALTRTGQQIADYILAHSAEVVRMSISQAARACGVGESTVHRFCRYIGQAGYTDMRLSLAECLRDRQQHAAAPSEVISPNDPCGAIVSKLCETMRDALHRTMRYLDIAALTSVTERLRNADHIALLGVGESMSMALHAYQRLMRSMPKAVCPQTEAMQRLTADGLRACDVAVIFPDDRLEQLGLDLITRGKRGGAYMICMTANEESPLARMCDQCCCCACCGEDGPETRPSLYCAQSFLIEAICLIYDLAPRDQNGYGYALPRLMRG